MRDGNIVNENSMDRNIEDLKNRVERLERAVFEQSTRSVQVRKATSKGGPTAGILNLITDGFFNAPKRKSLKEVMTALVQHGKDYSSQAVHIALQRMSRGKRAVLVKHKSTTGTNYVKRG